MKLTSKQREFLIRARRDTHADGSGSGARPHDRREIFTATTLHRKGLVTLPAAWTLFSGCRITEAGRALISKEQDNG
ncbi:hypothetical protein ACFFTN_01125 [Aminobacter aganoensis]|uniref:Uncharacterized protein n=1 Tax=Aminobacter aganoensis TaxID=83264 RepID=A0A7X0F5K9_9HYPH|nr:hypothetical protein [Aminobacter aganoensis]MBB6353542.1 hypothetical protein [Aminobacter aganoensis]